MGDELLKLENLSIEYKVKGGYLSAVKGVDLIINSGEIFAIVGNQAVEIYSGTQYNETFA